MGIDVINDVVGRRARPENCRHSHPGQCFPIFFRNDAAQDDEARTDAAVDAANEETQSAAADAANEETESAAEAEEAPSDEPAPTVTAAEEVAPTPTPDEPPTASRGRALNDPRELRKAAARDASTSDVAAD